MSFELLMETEIGDDGVVDGRKLARELIVTAYQALVPYVRGCPACADKLFEVIANGAIKEVHEAGRERGELPGGVYKFFGPEDGTMEHIERSVQTTRAMLEKTPGCCEH